MKSEDWKRVKRGQTLILARKDLGVVKATVVEIDIDVEVTYPTYRKEKPWGLTAETGTVKLHYDDTELIENLQNLIKYSSGVFARLKKAYDDWKTYKDYADAYEESFLTLISAEAAK